MEDSKTLKIGLLVGAIVKTPKGNTAIVLDKVSSGSDSGDFYLCMERSGNIITVQWNWIESVVGFNKSPELFLGSK